MNLENCQKSNLYPRQLIMSMPSGLSGKLFCKKLQRLSQVTREDIEKTGLRTARGLVSRKRKTLKLKLNLRSVNEELILRFSTETWQPKLRERLGRIKGALPISARRTKLRMQLNENTRGILLGQLKICVQFKEATTEWQKILIAIRSQQTTR